MIMLFIGLAVVALLIGLGLAFLAYKVMMWAGAPNYVAVMVGIAVFLLTGMSTQYRNK